MIKGKPKDGEGVFKTVVKTPLRPKEVELKNKEIKKNKEVNKSEPKKELKTRKLTAEELHSLEKDAMEVGKLPQNMEKMEKSLAKNLEKRSFVSKTWDNLAGRIGFSSGVSAHQKAYKEFQKIEERSRKLGRDGNAELNELVKEFNIEKVSEREPSTVIERLENIEKNIEKNILWSDVGLGDNYFEVKQPSQDQDWVIVPQSKKEHLKKGEQKELSKSIGETNTKELVLSEDEKAANELLEKRGTITRGWDNLMGGFGFKNLRSSNARNADDLRQISDLAVSGDLKSQLKQLLLNKKTSLSARQVLAQLQGIKETKTEIDKELKGHENNLEEYKKLLMARSKLSSFADRNEKIYSQIMEITKGDKNFDEVRSNLTKDIAPYMPMNHELFEKRLEEQREGDLSSKQDDDFREDKISEFFTKQPDKIKSETSSVQQPERKYTIEILGSDIKDVLSKVEPFFGLETDKDFNDEKGRYEREIDLKLKDKIGLKVQSMTLEEIEKFLKLDDKPFERGQLSDNEERAIEIWREQLLRRKEKLEMDSIR